MKQKLKIASTLSFIILTTVLLFTSVNLRAQSVDFPNRRFRVDISPLSNFAVGKNVAYMGIVLEPKFSITRNLSIGINVMLGGASLKYSKEKATFMSNDIDVSGYLDGASLIGFTGSFMGTVDWSFLPDAKIRPYLGIGAGISDINGLGIVSLYDNNNKGYNIDIGGFSTGNKFTLSPRIGIDFWHIRLNFSYSFMANPQATIIPASSSDKSSGAKADISNINLPSVDYGNFSGQLILFLGGGRKK